MEDNKKGNIVKTYSSETGLSFNVKKSGATKHTHVCFDNQTLGSSILMTSDERLQEAIEAHRFFKEGVITLVGASSTPEAEDEPIEAEAEAVKKPEVVEFKSVVEGKDYMAETYGLSRTNLRTRAAIEAAAKEQGLQVVWKD